MPLLLLDLDNTLVDRAAAFRSWAAAFIADPRATPALLDEMVRMDGDGLRPKPEVAADLTRLLDLDADESAGIVATLRAGVVAHLGLVPDAKDAIAAARAAGWIPFIG